MSTTAILVIAGGFVLGFLLASYLMKVVKDAREMEKGKKGEGDGEGSDGNR